MTSRQNSPEGRDLGYCRISLDTERSGSIDKQQRRLRAAAVAADRDPDSIVWYVDRNVSGGKVPMRDREGGGALLADVRPGDRVLITKIDRAARNAGDLLNIVKTIREAGATVTFIDDGINTEGPTGMLVLTILGAIAEFELELIRERRLLSLESFKEEGRHVLGKPPYGFKSVPNPRGKGLVIRPDWGWEADQLADAIKRVMKGEPQETVRKELTWNPDRAKDDGSLPAPLSQSGFNQLLRNPRLAGMTPEGVYEPYKDAKGQPQKRLKMSGVVMLKDGIPRIDPDAAILTLPDWAELKAFLGSGRAGWRRQNGYGRALVCATCGERLYKQVSKRKPEYATYRCQQVEKHTPGDAGRASVMVHAADAFIEQDFVSRFGSWPQTIMQWVDEDAARTEALALAQIRIEETQRKMGLTSDPGTIADLAGQLVEAHRARTDAEALPVERTRLEVHTGRTIAEAWADADDSEREDMILSIGVYRVRPGRLAPSVKVAFKPASPKGGETLSEALSRINTHLLTKLDG